MIEWERDDKLFTKGMQHVQMKREGMMKWKTALNWLIVAISCVSLMGFTSATGQGQAIIQVSPASARLHMGETVQVDLRIAQVSGLYGAEIHLAFDPAVLEVVDADPNQDGIQLIAGNMPSPDFVVLNRADNEAGTADYAVTQLPPNQPGEGDGTIVSITFRAKKTAISPVRLSRFLLANTQGQSIQATAQHGQISVTGQTTWVWIVIGAALALIVSSGIVFILLKRK